MKQLLLDLNEPQAPTLDNFAVGQNQELLHVLRQFFTRSSNEHFLYLWGLPTSGKTHLLQALTHANAHNAHNVPPLPTRYIDARHATRAQMTAEPSCTLYLLDNCEQLNPEQQIDAFALFNQIREQGSFLVSSGNVAPAILPVREDLRTRMGWGLIYQLHALTDTDKITTLQQLAQTRGWRLAPNILPWLITHYRRDMRSLHQALAALDQCSMETQRKMTLPLLREVLREVPDHPTDPQSEPEHHESGLI
jgi:DnaA family protein